MFEEKNNVYFFIINTKNNFILIRFIIFINNNVNKNNQNLGTFYEKNWSTFINKWDTNVCNILSTYNVF